MKATEFEEMYGRFLDVSGIARKRLDIAYADASPRQALDVYYLATGEGPFPTVVFFHGGGFFKGDKRRYQLAPALTGIARGYAVASVGYRIAPDAVWPAFAQDAALGLAYLQEHADELDLAAERMAVWGESAGAQLAMIVGLTDTARFGASVQPVRAVVDWYGPTGFARDNPDAAGERAEVIEDGMSELFGGKSLREYTFGASGEELAALLHEASVLENLAPGPLPATLIEHGLADDIVDARESRALEAALLERGGTVEARYVEGAGHGVGYFEDEENLDFVFDFIGRALG